MSKDMFQWWLGIFVAVEVACALAYLIHKERTNPQSKEQEEKFYSSCEKYIGKRATDILKMFV